jgi:hypothetical protein
MESTKSGKKNRKLGRDAKKCGEYRTMHRRERNKLKKIVRSNGLEFAKAWALERGVPNMVRG